MACSRYHNDICRIEKRNSISTYGGRYALDTPGPGADAPFIADPHMRAAKWGANFCNNMMDINSDLRGLTRPLNRDLPDYNSHVKQGVKPSQITYGDRNYITDESRATLPAWTFRDIEINRWETPLLNPLDQLEKPFHHNLNTRILERDYFVPSPDKFHNL
jgi:hypothetical protein